MDPRIEEAITRAQREADATQARKVRDNLGRVIFYWACVVIALLTTAWALWRYYDVSNVFLLVGLGASGLSCVLLCVWLLLDLSETMQNCPRWLEYSIKGTTLVAGVFFIVGAIAG